MEIQKIPVTRLNPAAYNPRVELKSGDKEYEKLKRSISEFGYVEPVIFNRQTGNVVGGHQRLAVMKDLGMTEIECVVVDLDLQREKALNIALNKIQGEWDETKLAAIMADFDAESFDVSLTGFDADEVDALLNKFYSHEAAEDDFDHESARKEIEESGGPVTEPGDMWRLGNHLLICGDPEDPVMYEQLLGLGRAQCAVTSPPIDPKEYAKDGLDPWLKRMAGVLKNLVRRADIICWRTEDMAKTGSQYIEPLALHSMKLFADEDFRPIWNRIWKMTGNVPTLGALQSSSNKPATEYDYISAFAGAETDIYNDQEYSWVSAFASHAFQFVKRLTRDERRKWGYAGVWEISVMARGKDGELQIPIELPWRCIKMHSDVGREVLDPFAGLGSTIMACEQSGRQCRAIEKDPMHCDLIIRRFEQFTGEKAVKL